MKLNKNYKFHLANGYSMPCIGLGTYRSISNESESMLLTEAIKCALKWGYRHIDTGSLIF